jgi:AcrR family transcriptional regulator
MYTAYTNLVYTVYVTMTEIMTVTTTTQKIANAAVELLDRDGAEGVTMRRVASAVGMTPMALYRHYPNRDGLLNALANDGFAKLAEKLAALKLKGSVERQLLTILEVFLDHAFERPRLFELMFLTRREGARQYPADFRARLSPTANLSADVIASAMEKGDLHKDDVWEIVFETGALMQGLVMLYLGGRVAMPQEEFRNYCHRSFRRYLNGIRK